MEDYYLIMEEHVLFYIPQFCQAKLSVKFYSVGKFFQKQ